MAAEFIQNPREKIARDTALDQESWPIVRIRGANPPIVPISELSELQRKLTTITVFSAVPVAFIVLGVTHTPYSSPFWLLGAPAFAIFLFILYRSVSRELTERAKVLNVDVKDGGLHPQIVPLLVYDAEFTCPLANRSTIVITVHFQVPYSLDPFVRDIMSRVVKAKLIMFTQQLANMPERDTVKDFLETDLVQFQDENKISVLRVDVPLIIPVEKKTSGGFMPIGEKY